MHSGVESANRFFGVGKGRIGALSLDEIVRTVPSRT
jgi:hypothetical protein